MTYNIHHGVDANGKNTLKDIGKYIMDSRADIVGLQEVDSMCERSGKIDQPAQLSKLSGLGSYFTRHFPYQGGSYGQALLSAYTVTHLENVSLPVFPLSSGKSVSMLVADVEIAERKITIAVVHLDYRNQESRLHQINVLWDHLKDKNKNLILMGDMNAFPNSDEMQRIRENFIVYPFIENAYSFPAVNPDRRIDFVLVRKGSDLRIVSESVGNVPYSDHLPVITTIDFN